ncbi:MAG: hypothetical protein LBP73_08010 [Clostridiales Family XIII bacterium]|jgi:CRISPR type III-A/MTUBE-associated protein Csm6|nr:hypothetical protein [Clostridiales Family XIII bacterium]
MKRILFSPIGGNDPIGNDNNRDGSFLHICRHYRPDKAYMYMSKEILDYQNLDKRYTYCLDRLCESIGISVECEIIAGGEKDNVHEYDYFYEKFGEVLRDIRRENPNCELLLNVSSGTPSMKTALQVIALLGDYDMTPVQVSSPNRAMNPGKEDRRDYVAELRWECNDDNAPGAENRCAEVKSPNLLALWRKDLIKKYVKVYDYVAACRIADDMAGRLDKDAAALLRACRCRLRLDTGGVEKALRDVSDKIPKSLLFPQPSSDIRNVFEYLLWLEIKLKNEEYADFIRGVTPVADEIFRMLLAKIGIELTAYYDAREYKENGKRKTRYTLSPEKVGKDPEVAAAFESRYRNIDARALGTDNLGVLLDCKLKSKTEKDKLRIVSEFAKKDRNSFAHEISAVTEEWMKGNGGEPKKVWKALQHLFHYSVGGRIKEAYWASYDAANDEIERLLT